MILRNRFGFRFVTLVVTLAALASASIASAKVDKSSHAGALPPVANIKFSVAVAVPDPGQVFLYVPEGFGFFKAERLNVSVQFNNGGGAALQGVATGAADYGLSSPENLWNGIATGMPLRGYALVLTNSIYHNGIGVRSDSPITSIAQLKGKKIGVSSFTSGSFPSAKAKIASAGLDPDKDVTFVPIGNGGPAANAIQNNQVDAAVTTETQWEQIKALGVNVRYLPKSTNKVDDLPADVIFTRADTLSKNPGVSTRFARAVMEGTIAALANPNKALDYYYKLYPEPANALTRQQNMAIMMARLEDMKLIAAQKGKWGYLPIALYNQVQKLGLQFGTVNKEQDINQLFTNKFNKAINQLDAKRITRQAKASK
jgi:NitT/TauT family transport system substrate-binding protein